MQGQDPKVQKIIQWRESLSLLDSDTFFLIMRNYLGEIKTPFSKPKLIESLSAFLRNSQNKSRILSLLTKEDVELLSVIDFLDKPDIQSLRAFVGSDKTGIELVSQIENLTQRLLVFTVENTVTSQQEIMINPMLEDDLKPYLGINRFFSKGTKISTPRVMLLTPQVIAAFVSLVKENPDFVKMDGTLKKKAVTLIEKTFVNYTDGNIKRFQLLFNALSNAGIFTTTEKGTRVEFERLQTFASMPYPNQVAYLAAYGAGHFSRGTISQMAQNVLDLLNNIPVEGYSPLNLARLCIILKNGRANLPEQKATSRFAQLIAQQQAKMEQSSESQSIRSSSYGYIAELLIDFCIEWGVLYKTCTVSETDYYAVHIEFFSVEKIIMQNRGHKPLSMDTAFTITLQSGLNLLQYCQMLPFIKVERCDVADTYNLNRSTVTAGFEKNISIDSMISILQNYCSYPLPDVLRLSLEEWYDFYSSATLYFGYVFKVNESKAGFVKNNPVLTEHIKEELAPNIFLMDFKNEEEASKIIAKSGMDYTGKIKSDDDIPASLPYQKLLEGYILSLAGGTKKTDGEEGEKILQELRTALENLDALPEQKEGLLYRINHRLVVDPVQLRPSTVQFEVMEATAMDYTGKIHLIESAIERKQNLRILIEENEITEYTGFPVVLQKDYGNAFLVLKQKSDSGIEEIKIEVSKILLVKRLL